MEQSPNKKTLRRITENLATGKEKLGILPLKFLQKENPLPYLFFEIFPQINKTRLPAEELRSFF